MCLTHIYTMLESSSSESLLVLTRATQHIAKNYMHKSSVIYYMTESSQMQIFYSFYFQVLSASHPYYLVSAHIYIYPSICIYLHFLISSYCLSFLILSIIFHILYIRFQILLDSYLLSLFLSLYLISSHTSIGSKTAVSGYQT